MGHTGTVKLIQLLYYLDELKAKVIEKILGQNSTARLHEQRKFIGKVQWRRMKY